jgi:small subunit ribosomal protein S21
MIIIELSEGENIDRALKRYKRKHHNLKLKQELRNRQHYTKKSVQRRNQVISAAYRLKKFGSE